MNNERIASELLKVAEGLTVGGLGNDLNDLKVMKEIASIIKYKVDPRPKPKRFLSERWTSWSMTSEKDFLEIQVSIADTLVSVYAFPLTDSQEAIAGRIRKNVDFPFNFPDKGDLLAFVVNVRNKALSSPEVHRLRLESTRKGQ